jgi:hypothetical protein
MKESDRREKILNRMKSWPWDKSGMFVMDEEDTGIVIKALEVLEARKEYQHKRYLTHQDEKKQQSKENYKKQKNEAFRRLYDEL